MLAITLCLSITISLSGLYKADTQNITSLCFSSNSNRLVTVDDQGTVQVRLIPAGDIVLETKVDTPLRAVAYSPTGGRIVAGGDNNQVFSWKTASLEQEWKVKFPFESVNGIAFTSDGKTIACATSPNDTVRLLDAVNGKVRSSFSFSGNGATAVAFISRNRKIVSGGQVFKVWNVSKAVRTSESHAPDTQLVDASKAALLNSGIMGWTTAVDVFPDDRYIAAAGDASPEDRGEPLSVVMIDLEKKAVVRVIGRSKSGIEAVSVSPDGYLVAAGDSSGKLRIWNVKTNQEVPVVSPDLSAIHCLSFSPDGKMLAVAGNGGIRIYPVNRRRLPNSDRNKK